MTSLLNFAVSYMVKRINLFCAFPAIYPLSCEALKQEFTRPINTDISTKIDLDGSGPLPPFSVICNFFKDGRVQTTLDHLNRERTRVIGFQEPGSYQQYITYLANEHQIHTFIERYELGSDELKLVTILFLIELICTKFMLRFNGMFLIVKLPKPQCVFKKPVNYSIVVLHLRCGSLLISDLKTADSIFHMSVTVQSF